MFHIESDFSSRSLGSERWVGVLVAIVLVAAITRGFILLSNDVLKMRMVRKCPMSDGPAEPKRAQTSLGKALRTVVGSRHQFNSHFERRQYNRRHVRIQPEPHLVGHVHRQASTTGEVASRPRL